MYATQAAQFFTTISTLRTIAYRLY